MASARESNYLPIIDPDPSWRDHARCAGTSPAPFFPEHSRLPSPEVYAFCNDCTVRAECLNFAVVNKETQGIWGGLSPRERNAVVRRRKRKAEIAAIMEGLSA